MDAGGRLNMVLESKSERAYSHATEMILESERRSSDPEPFVALCV